tara:strand:+ start:548 stop:898 length:351 start_codon:yes stop_codon:yes gene_type:complete
MSKIIEKPWGKEELLEINDKYMVKRLTMWAGHKCSLQYHNIKKETIYVLSGILKIYTGSSKEFLKEKIYETGMSITIPTGLIHRMEAIEDCIYLESSTPEMDDVIRLDDDYARAIK